MLGDKLRFRFAKTGTLRLLSHHDLMRCLERMLRRADVPFKSTAGFHPGPRVVFALSLPLGVVGRDEVVEIELLQPCESDDVLAKLNAQAPAGLSFARAAVVPMKVTALPRRVRYELPLPAERIPATQAAIDQLRAAEKLWVERLRPTPKRLNIRPYIRGIELNTEASPLQPGGSIALDLWVTQTGTARAEELLRFLGVADLLDAGAVLERTAIELRDEVTDATEHPPDGPADALPLEPAAAAALLQREDEPNQHAGTLSGPVVE